MNIFAQHIFRIVAAIIGLLWSFSVVADAQSTYLQPYYNFTTLATGTSFSQPQGLALDTAGNLYVADTGNQVIRKIAPTGQVSIFAGVLGSAGWNDGPGASALFNDPRGMALDSNGNLFVADTDNHVIRKITPDGTVSTYEGKAGVPGSVGGTGTAPRFNQPYGVAFDPSGNMFVADYGNNVIRKVTPLKTVTVFAGKVGMYGSANGYGSAASFNYPEGVATDLSGNVYVTDVGNSTIRKINPYGNVTTMAGTPGVTGAVDGTGAAAQFCVYPGIGVDKFGNVYVADYYGTIRKITPAQVVTTIGGTSFLYGVVDGAGPDARFYTPYAIAVDPTGIVYMADRDLPSIRMGATASVAITLPYRDEYFDPPRYDGYPWAVSVTTNPPGLNVGITYNGNATPPTNAGTYAVVAKISDAAHPEYNGVATNTLVIEPDYITTFYLNDPYYWTGNSPNIVGTGLGSDEESTHNFTFTYSGTSDPSVAPTDVGYYTVTATVNDPNFAAATYSRTIEIKKSSQYVSLAALSAPVHNVITLSGSAESTTAVVYSFDDNGYAPDPFSPIVQTSYAFLSDDPGPNAAPNSHQGNMYLHITGTGRITVYATDTGDPNYDSGTSGGESSDEDYLTQQVISDFAPISNVSYGLRSITVTPPSCDSGLAVVLTVKSGPATMSGNVVTFTGVGTVTLAANQLGDGVTYDVADEKTVAFNVLVSGQTITFPAVGTRFFGADPFTPAVSASSGLPVALSITSGPATMSNNKITLTGTGAVVVKAVQAGNANYTAAAPVSVSFTVLPANVPHNLFWDATTAVGLANGSGSWDDGVTSKWSDSNAGTSNPLLIWGDDDSAIFQAAGTMTATLPTGTTIRLNGLTQAVAGTALTVTGGTLQFDATGSIVNAATTNHSLIVNSPIALNSPSVTIDNEGATGSIQLNGIISEIGGTRALAKIGPGILTFGTVANTFTGGVTLNAIGQVVFNNSGNFGTGAITFNAGTSLTSTAQISTASTSAVSTLPNNLVVTPGHFGAYTGNHTMTLTGSLSGTGTFLVIPGTSAASVTLTGDNHLFAGTVAYADNGVTPLFLGSATAGSGGVWQFTGGSTKGLGLNLPGFPIFSFGEMASASGIGRIFNNQAGSFAILTIGDATSNVPSFGGAIVDGTAGGTIGLTKTGTDNQVLTGTSTYSGPTTINGGTLTVNGSLGVASSVSIANGGTLAGVGTIKGNVNLFVGGSISPGGAGTVGTLTVGGAAGLTGSGSGGILNFELATPTASDKLALTGTYRDPATSTVTINLKALTGFANGTYPLITGATGISAANFVLGTTPASHTYQLTVSGSTLSVVVGTPGGGPLAPTGLAAIAANAEVDLAWSASSGATSYSVLRGTASGGPYATIVNGLTATSYADMGLVNGTPYYYVVTATNASGTSIYSSQVSATPNTTTVDSFWFDNDIGAVGQDGNSSYSAGTFTLNGSGLGVSGTADSLDYTYQPLVGDGAIIARVATQTGGISGVMMRESLAANSSVVGMLIKAGAGAVFQDRVTMGGTAVTGASNAAIAVPNWVKLARAGNVFTGYTSPDGVTWTQVGTITAAMASGVEVGLAQSSLTNAALASATFTNVSVVPTASWASQDIGPVPIVGASYFSGGVATVQGTGASIFNNSDQFRYTYLPASGDCDITARVASLANTNTAAKAGIMIRASLTAASVHALAYVTPSSGLALEWRLLNAGYAGHTTAILGLKAPYYLRLTRVGNLFTAYCSPDGTTWTSVGSQTVTMPQAVYIGLPVCSYNTTTPCTATFDHIIVNP